MKKMKHSKPLQSRRLVFVVLFALIGLSALLLTGAASPAANVEAENGTLSGATKAADSTASAGNFLQFGGDSTTPPPGPAGRPSAANTGPVSGASTRGAIQATNGQVIRNVIIDANGARYGVHVKSGIEGVVIENVIIKNAGSAGVYCEQKASCTIRNSEILEMQNDAIKVHGSALVEGNYMHHLGKQDGSHADAVQMQYATNSGSIFRNNFCDIGFPAPSGYRSNACFQIQDQTTNVVIENNWLNGGNYTINCKSGTGVSNITIRNNWFGTSQYGRITGCSMTGAMSM